MRARRLAGGLAAGLTVLGLAFALAVRPAAAAAAARAATATPLSPAAEEAPAAVEASPTPAAPAAPAVPAPPKVSAPAPSSASARVSSVSATAPPTAAQSARVPALSMAEGSSVSVERALARRIDADWERKPLASVLELLGQMAGLEVTLDPPLARAAARQMITYAAQNVEVRVALGHVLRQAALRYAVEGERLFVSTRERLLARLAGDAAEAEPVEESEPVTAADLLRSLGGPEEEEFQTNFAVPPNFGFGTDVYYLSPSAPLGITYTGSYPYDPADAYAYSPARPLPRSYYDPRIGLWNHPGPLLFNRPLDYSLQRRAAYFTPYPYYVAPEFRGLVPQGLSDAVEFYAPPALGLALPGAAAPLGPPPAPAPERAERTTAAAAAAAAVAAAAAADRLAEAIRGILREEPGISARDLLRRLEGEPAPAAPAAPAPAPETGGASRR